MTNILHISYELRDREFRRITKAVQNLISSTRSFSEPVIIDLVRVTSLNKELIEIDERGHLNINAFGLPYGLFLRSHLNRIYSFIETAEQKNLISLKNIDVVHAHKVTFEGYIGYKIAQKLNVPLILTLRSTDFTVFHYRPDLHSLYKKIMSSAYKIVYLVPSMIEFLIKNFGQEYFDKYLKHKLVQIPNIIIRNNSIDDERLYNSEEPHLLTALSLTKRSVKGKNLRNLLKAVSEINHLDVKLKIAGDGIYEPVVKNWVNDLNLSNKVEFLGRIPNSKIDKYYSNATAFVLPSLNETFGMVYPEALFNGTPILCSKGVIGFDGFFKDVGVSVNPHSVEDIRRGIIELITNNTYFRNKIYQLKSSGAFNMFNPENVSNLYREMLAEIIKPGNKVLSY
jgi:glycosyltransferase involved in cell wall biosynthesis